MSERNLRSYIVKGLKKAGQFVHAVENPCRPGTPDVYGCSLGSMFWIELKWVADWPKRNGRLDIKHFTKEQRLWLRQNGRAGGKSFVLLQVYNQWFLLNGIWAADNIGEADQEAINEGALLTFTGNINFHHLAVFLEKGNDSQSS